MGIPIIGGGMSEAPFNRTFFNVTLGDLMEENGKERPVKLTLFLVDGSTLDVCKIDEMADAYLAVRAYQGQSDSCEMSSHLIPYGIIYRIEMAPRVTDTSGRMGFSWQRTARKGTALRRR